MTTLPESDRYLEAAYDTVNRFAIERERRQVAFVGAERETTSAVRSLRASGNIAG